MNNTNFPYYPEPINETKQQKNVQSEQQKEPQKDAPPFANILQNLENMNSNNLLSSLLSSGVLGGSSNPLISQALAKILSTKQEKSKKEGSSPPCTFEEL